MKFFKCLSQNVSVVQGKEETPQRKSLLGFRQKKRQSVGVSKSKELTPNKRNRFQSISASDICIDEIQQNSCSEFSVRSSFCNSSVACSTICDPESMANSTSTVNKGCSTAPYFTDSQSSLSFTSIRSVPVKLCHGETANSLDDTRQNGLMFTTHVYSDPCLTSTGRCRKYYPKHATTHTYSSTKEQDAMDCDSAKTMGRNNSISATDIDYDSTISTGNCLTITDHRHEYYLKHAATHTYSIEKQDAIDCDSVRTVGKDYNSLSQTGIDYDSTISTGTCLTTTGRRREYYPKHAATHTYSSTEKQDAIKCDSVRATGRDYNSLSATGIDYDATFSTGIHFDSTISTGIAVDSTISTGIAVDSTISTGEYNSMGTANSSQASRYLWPECPASQLELKYKYIEELMSLELEFVDYMYFGIQKYSKPLLYSILTCHQHRTIFMNIKKLVKMSEANLKSLRDNTAANDSQTSEDQHMVLYLPAAVYTLEIQKQCQAYEMYGKGLNKSNRCLSKLMQNKIFLDFVKSQHATREQYKDQSEQCPSIWEFIHRPALHIQQLHTALYNILTVTPRDSHDAPTLVRIHEKMLQCIQTMNLRKYSE